MTFGDLRSYAILNPYDVPYNLLKFVPLITNHPIYSEAQTFFELNEK